MDRILLFSSDNHASPLVEDFKPYMEKEFHEALDAQIKEQHDILDARKVKMDKGGSLQMQAQTIDYDARAQFALDMKFRLGVLEDFGYAAELVFPDGKVGNRIPFTGRHLLGTGPKEFFPDHWAAGLRAFNRWLGEQSVPDRQFGVGLVPFHDPEYALKQVGELRSLGLRSMMPQWDALDSVFPHLYSRAFDPVWAKCAEDQIPITFHPDAGRPRNTYGLVDENDVFQAASYISFEATQDAMMFEVERMFWSRRAFWEMILGGVLERHPTLKIGFFEMYTDWVPRTLKRLDYLVSNAKNREASWEDICPRLPSEYFASQVFVGPGAIWTDEEIAMRREIGVSSLAYGPDYPHGPCPWNSINPFLRATIGVAGVSEQEARLMLGENMLRMFDLDPEILAPIVEQIGPTPDEVLSVDDLERDLEQLSPYTRFANKSRESTSAG